MAIWLIRFIIFNYAVVSFLFSYCLIYLFTHYRCLILALLYWTLWGIVSFCFLSLQSFLFSHSCCLVPAYLMSGQRDKETQQREVRKQIWKMTWRSLLIWKRKRGGGLTLTREWNKTNDRTKSERVTIIAKGWEAHEEGCNQGHDGKRSDLGHFLGYSAPKFQRTEKSGEGQDGDGNS